MESQSSKRRLVLVLCIMLLTALHFGLDTRTHALHVVHVILQGLYLLPIVAAALWFGLHGGTAAAAFTGAAYFAHIRWSWPNQPMENAQQIAMIGVYLLVGIVSGVLVDLQNRERRRRIETEQRAQREATLQGFASLCNALGVRDEYTRRHSEQVSRLAVEIGRRRGLHGEGLELLRLAALVHDIGKIGVGDEVLHKPGRLNADERARMERHPLVAAEILRPLRGTEQIARIVEAHHECPDGSGYPSGLKDGQIPLQALVLSVADVYSALTTSRPYKPAMTSTQAMEVLHRMAGPKLDATSVKVLQQMLRAGVWPENDIADRPARQSRPLTNIPSRISSRPQVPA